MRKPPCDSPPMMQPPPLAPTLAPTLDNLTQRLIAFRDARDWGQFHSLRNLIASLSIEAAELLELTQWKGDAELEAACREPGFRHRLEEECADVLLYLLLVCERAGIDLMASASAKIEANAAKYPVDKARGSARKYTEL